MTERGYVKESRARRLLELLRAVGKGGCLIGAAEFHGVRGYLQEYPDVWSEFAGLESKSKQRYRVEQSAFALKVAGFQEIVSRVLGEHGVRFLGLKGLSVSHLLYGDICRREFGDLDLLVSPNDALRAIELLERHGFDRTYPNNFSASQNLALVRYGKAQNLYRKSSSLSLDLHWKLVSAWIGDDIYGFEELWSRSQELHRQGMSPWRTLGPEDTLIFLALHGFQDGFPRLKQLLDLSRALESVDYDFERVLELAGPRAALVEKAVNLVDCLVGSEEGNSSFSTRRDALQFWLDMAKKDKTPQSNLLRGELWSCSAPEALARSFKAMMTPALDDLASLSLPTSLIGLYPLVRAFRLIKKALERFGERGR